MSAVLLKRVFISQFIDAVKWSLESRNVMQFTIAGTLPFPTAGMRHMTGLVKADMLTAGPEKVNSGGRKTTRH